MSIILPTGNPFVDTGMYAMQAHASKEFCGDRPVEALTPELLSKVLGDGKPLEWLAKANRLLNSFFMVSGTNSALVNPSTNKQAYRTKRLAHLDEADTGWKEYIATLRRLRDETLSTPTSPDGQPTCEACGERPASRVIGRVGRDNFPLAGSLGNDAQALPAASRSPRVCALCLLAIQWLPLGAIMFKGRLACFQFTHALLSRLFVEETYREIRARLPTPNAKGKVTVPGSGEGATPATLILLDRMRQLQLDREDYDLPPYVTLNVWAFTNSGANPDCEVIEIENPALQFLWRTAREHYVEIKNLLRREDPKKPGTHLLSAIERRSDYGGLYPRKAGKGKSDTPPASEELYELYQTQILNRPPAALRTAKRLAAAAYSRLNSGDKKQKKLLEQTFKESPRWSKGKEARVYLRRLFVTLAEEGELRLDSYVCLFPAANLDATEVTSETALSFWCEPGRAIRPSTQGWDVFWFYLHHVANGTSADGADDTLTGGEGDLVMFTNPKIQTFARDVFDYFMEGKGGRDRARGLAYIKRHVLEPFGRGKVTNNVLRQWFCKLAETREGYRCEDWDSLCRDEQGNDATGELRFQMRLELSNLYRQAQVAATT